ncbi:hypothetical protein HY285_04090 [Candidatus Peregrinibacteria bacterium]|nr:hypothetical protein [Candidatus Peregrinibacteria bacterium]MBI3816695.1 hypothetical protein [Candidatus Peregrinibacteria bacterium]
MAHSDTWKRKRERAEHTLNAFLKNRLPFLHAGMRALRLCVRKQLWRREVTNRLRRNQPLTNRSHLPVLLSVLGLRGEGAEVGVLNGYFSELILMYSDLSVLHSIDPWHEFDGSYDDKHNALQCEQDERHAFTCKRLAPYGERSRIHRMTSREAAPAFADGSLDFVYIICIPTNA